jgi:hypothetical protein
MATKNTPEVIQKRVGEAPNRSEKLAVLRSVIDETKAEEKAAPRAESLLETHKQLDAMRDQIKSEKKKETGKKDELEKEEKSVEALQTEVRGILRNDHPLTKAHLSAEATGVTNAASKLPGGETVKEETEKFKKDEMGTQIVKAGLLAGGVVFLTHMLLNGFKRVKKGLGRAAKAVGITALAVLIWNLMKKKTGGGGGSGKPGDGKDAKGKEAETPKKDAAPKPKDGKKEAVPVVVVPPEDPKAKAVEPEKKALRRPADVSIRISDNKGKPEEQWYFPIYGTQKEKIGFDIRQEDQKWFYNGITGERYTVKELTERMEQLKKHAEDMKLSVPPKVYAGFVEQGDNPYWFRDILPKCAEKAGVGIFSDPNLKPHHAAPPAKPAEDPNVQREWLHIYFRDEKCDPPVKDKKYICFAKKGDHGGWDLTKQYTGEEFTKHLRELREAAKPKTLKIELDIGRNDTTNIGKELYPVFEELQKEGLINAEGRAHQDRLDGAHRGAEDA